MKITKKRWLMVAEREIRKAVFRKNLICLPSDRQRQILECMDFEKYV